MRKIPDFWVEQYALNELSKAKRLQVEEALGDSLQDRLASLRSSNKVVLKALPPKVFASRVSEAVPPRRGTWKMMIPVAVAMMGLVFVAPALRPSPNESLEVTRAKGGALLQVFKRDGAEVSLLKDGERAAAGDVLQVSYTSGGAEFGAVGSIDGNGILTWHLPLHGRHSVQLQRGSGVPLAQSYEIDDAPRHEHFFFVTSPADFDLQDIEDVMEGWRLGDTVNMPAPMRTVEFTVGKAP